MAEISVKVYTQDKPSSLRALTMTLEILAYKGQIIDYLILNGDDTQK